MKTCEFCKRWSTLKRETIKAPNGTVVKHFRFCPKKPLDEDELTTQIVATTPACIHFEAAKYFYCDEYSEYVATLACVDRSCQCHKGDRVLHVCAGVSPRKLGAKVKLATRG